jgi:O-antigen/teichoic acid export membrane protein
MAQMTAVALVMIQGIFLVRLYLRFLGVPLYGAWLASTQLVGWVTILDPGTDEVLRQRVANAYGRGQRDELGEFIGTGLVINVLIAICITGASALLTPALPGWFRVTGQSAGQLIRAAVVLAVASGATVVAYALGSSLQALQRAGGYGIVLIVGNGAGLVLNIGLLYAGWGLTAIAAGFLLKAVVWVIGWSCVLIWVCRRHGPEPVQFSFSASRARELIRLAGYMLVSKIASMLQTSSDGVLTGMMLGSSQTATLVLTGRIIDAAKMIPDRIGAAMQPSLSNLVGAGNREQSTRVSAQFLTTVSLVGALLIATAVVLNRDIIRLWVGAALYGGQSLTALIGVSALLTLLSTAIYHVLFANGMIETTAKITLVAGVVKVTFMAILLPWLGLIAVPIATTAAILIVTGPRYLRALSLIKNLDQRQQRRFLIGVLSGPLVCVILAAALAKTPIAATWPAAALKSAAILGILTGAIFALQPVARRQALAVLALVRLKVCRCVQQSS